MSNRNYPMDSLELWLETEAEIKNIIKLSVEIIFLMILFALCNYFLNKSNFMFLIQFYFCLQVNLLERFSHILSISSFFTNT